MKTNTHHTVVKGDVAVAAVVFDLTKRGYIVSTPLTENSPYDLVCDVGDKLLRLQVKFRAKGVIPKVSSWMSSEGTVTCPINRSKFDYYVIVNEDCTKLAYVHSSVQGSTIRWVPPTSYGDYLFWEDFQPFTETIKKRTCDVPAVSKVRIENNPDRRTNKIVWPTDEELKKLVWGKPSVLLAEELGVSDSAIGNMMVSLVVLNLLSLHLSNTLPQKILERVTGFVFINHTQFTLDVLTRTLK
jgi:hypothetical protein